MISDNARELFRNGKIREAITRYRHALRFETDAFEKARIYIDLSRIYRLRVRMKNAQLEVRRAFKVLGLAWPENTVCSVLQAYFTQASWPKLHPDFEKKSLILKTQLLVDLYEEVGVSTYYLRQIWTFIQSTLKSKKPSHALKSSRPLLNWCGGTACVVAAMDLTLHGLINRFTHLSAGAYVKTMGFLHRKSLRLMGQCHDVAIQLNTHADLGKALMWEALLCEWHGDPVHSADLFETCLNQHGKYMEPIDVRFCTVSLTLNYMTRGHFQRSLDVLKKQGEYNLCLLRTLEEVSMDSISWYSLGARAMLGEINEIQKIVKIFSSILSADKDEKWLLTQYLGQLLIAGRQTGLPYSQAEDLISRYEVLGMSAREAHTETGYYWIGEAYTRFSFAVHDQTLIKKFKLSLEKLGQLLPHPTPQSHYAVLKAGLAWLEGKQTAYTQWVERATREALRIDNQWALLELSQLKTLTSAPDAWGGLR